ADRIVCQEGKHVRSKVKHHEMGGVLLTHQPAGEKGETGLHEEHKIPGEERPAKVRGNPGVTDGVRQFGRERLFGRLGLVFVKVLPSPILPVRALAMINSTTSVTLSSGSKIWIFTLGKKSTVYSAPR